jgi:hypothetical protein
MKRGLAQPGRLKDGVQGYAVLGKDLALGCMIEAINKAT